ncbi:MAG: PIG-L deacetylase family protein [Rikenellaceae bacterium MAG02]
MNKVLVVAVHPDDETLGCGGTLLKHKNNGDEIYWLIITSPTLNHPYGFSQEVIDERISLVNQITEKYKFHKTILLNYPTQLLHAVDLRELIVSINKVIIDLEPNITYMMFKNDVHSDHRVAFDAIYSCTKSFRYPFITKILMYETLSETEFAPALPYASFIPNVYVDITDYLDQKIEIMKLYETELMEAPYPRSISSIEALARFRGSRAGVKYAEAFMLLYEKI